MRDVIHQAIQTKYHGPTNVCGSRISARARAGRIFLHYDSSKNSDDNHRLAAETLAKKYKWDEGTYGKLVGGGLSDDSYVWVFVKK